MKSGVEKQGFGLPIFALILGLIILPKPTQADLVGFNYINLVATYSGGVLTVVNQTITEADVDRRVPPTSDAYFSNSAGYNLTMTITNVTATSASGSGTLTLTDINGDKITANISGTWDNVFAPLARLTATLSNVQFVCANNCIFEGTDGSFPMTFTAPQPYVGNALTQVGGWFDVPFSGKPSQINGLIYPLQATIAAWRSVRTHGAGGPLSITLNPTASGNGPSGPTVESRSGGIREIAVDFDRPVSLTATPALGISVSGRQTTYPGGIATMGAPTGYAPALVSLMGANTVLIDFNAGALPDESSYTITLNSGMINESIAGDRDCNIRSLYGDATGDGIVRLSDALLIRSRTGASVFINPQLDLNLSNVIDQSDVLAAKARVISPAHQALAP